jgi:hypothetical protein
MMSTLSMQWDKVACIRRQNYQPFTVWPALGRATLRTTTHFMLYAAFTKIAHCCN